MSWPAFSGEPDRSKVAPKASDVYGLTIETRFTPDPWNSDVPASKSILPSAPVGLFFAPVVMVSLPASMRWSLNLCFFDFMSGLGKDWCVVWSGGGELPWLTVGSPWSVEAPVSCALCRALLRVVPVFPLVDTFREGSCVVWPRVDASNSRVLALSPGAAVCFGYLSFYRPLPPLSGGRSGRSIALRGSCSCFC